MSPSASGFFARGDSLTSSLSASVSLPYLTICLPLGPVPPPHADQDSVPPWHGTGRSLVALARPQTPDRHLSLGSDAADGEGPRVITEHQGFALLVVRYQTQRETQPQTESPPFFVFVIHRDVIQFCTATNTLKTRLPPLPPTPSHGDKCRLSPRDAAAWHAPAQRLSRPVTSGKRLVSESPLLFCKVRVPVLPPTGGIQGVLSSPSPSRPLEGFVSETHSFQGSADLSSAWQDNNPLPSFPPSLSPAIVQSLSILGNHDRIDYDSQIGRRGSGQRLLLAWVAPKPGSTAEASPHL